MDSVEVKISSNPESTTATETQLQGPREQRAEQQEHQQQQSQVEDQEYQQEQSLALEQQAKEKKHQQEQKQTEDQEHQQEQQQTEGQEHQLEQQQVEGQEHQLEQQQVEGQEHQLEQQQVEVQEHTSEQQQVQGQEHQQVQSHEEIEQDKAKDEESKAKEDVAEVEKLETAEGQEMPRPTSVEKKEEGTRPPNEGIMRTRVESDAQTATKERSSKSLERPVTQQSTTSLRGESRQEKKRREKKAKRRSRHSTGEAVPPKLKKKSRGSRQSITTGESMKHLEVFILSLYQSFDPQNSGYIDPSVFWQVLESNLQLNTSELAGLKALVVPKKSGLISYEEFASQATDMISSLYQGQPASDEHWVELKALDGSMVVSYNKQTGEIKDLVESGADLFEGVISEMFQLADQGQKGYVSKDEFTTMLQSAEMLPYLQQEDILQMQQYFSSIQGGRASYTDFYPLAKEIILRVYRVKDPSESEWCQLNSPHVGLFWFNKYTGEARRIPADDREQEIDFLTRTYNQMEGLQAELEQCKQQNRDLENTLAQANEEQEALAAQLYETGHALDEANNEVQRKENELDQVKNVISSKEQEILQLKLQVAELEKLQEKLTLSEHELQNARQTIEIRDHNIGERDANISDLRKQTETITERLKAANGVIDARESSITTLQQDLQAKQTQVKEFEKQVPELEVKVASTEDQLKSTKQMLDEKTSALSQARKHLRNARERNMELEKEVEKLCSTQEKLHNAESEIRTLKSFLTTKTAIVEKRKRELRDTKAKMSELEEKDARRAVILADVLEKTARQYQQQLGALPTSRSGKVSPGKSHAVVQTPLQTQELRPASAPAIPPEGEQLDQEPSIKPMLKSYTLDGLGMDSVTVGAHVSIEQRETSVHKKPKARSRTVPKLPPIRQPRPIQRTRTFAVPTPRDIQSYYRNEDMAITEHASSNPQCNCELCRMNASIMGPSTLRPETGLTSNVGTRYQSETDVRELALSRQLRIGQRVLVRVKKTEFDFEPQQLTGIIKFIGKLDSEFIDNRIYVGVKLDEAAGNTDGLIKGKRYFTCPPKHGKVVRITSVVAVLPNKSVCYRPVQKITKRSPYTTVQKKVKIS